jgi:hypothetical protein
LANSIPAIYHVPLGLCSEQAISLRSVRGAFGDGLRFGKNRLLDSIKL